MPDKLTDSEIVKALECKPKAELVILCNRLQAENEKWQGGYMTQKQEIANLEIEFKAMRGAANSYKAENERLKEEVERLNNAIDEQDIEIAQLYKRLDKAKTEAYTDFAKSLKKDFENPHIQKFGLDFVKFLKNVVDNRLKKLGDDNA